MIHFARDYTQCVCHAGEEAFCKALGEPGCRCLAPMMEVKDEVKSYLVSKGFAEPIAEAEAKRMAAE